MRRRLDLLEKCRTHCLGLIASPAHACPRCIMLMPRSPPHPHAAIMSLRGTDVHEMSMAQQIDALVTQLKEGSKKDKERAARSLGNLPNLHPANHEQLCAKIVDAGALMPLVRLLTDGSEVAKGQAANALAQLAVYSEQRSAKITNAGASQPLVTLLKEGSEGVKECRRAGPS